MPGLLDESVRLQLPSQVGEAAGTQQLGLDQRGASWIDDRGQQALRLREKGLAFGGPTRGTEGRSSCLGRRRLRTWELCQTSPLRLLDDRIGGRESLLRGAFLKREACQARPRQNAPGEIVPAVRRRKRQRLSELVPGLVRPPSLDAEEPQREVNVPFRVHCRRRSATEGRQRLIEERPTPGQVTRCDPGLGEGDRRVGALERPVSLGPDRTRLFEGLRGAVEPTQAQVRHSEAVQRLCVGAAPSSQTGERGGRGLDELERLLAPLAALELRGSEQAIVLESEEVPGADAPHVSVVRRTVVVL